jgi:hypothetical protein
MTEICPAKRGLPSPGRIARLAKTQGVRIGLHALLRNLVTWRPLPNPEPGYTVVLGCMKSMAAVIVANLRLCAQMDANRLHEFILVFDCSVDEIPPAIGSLIAEIEPSIKIRVFGYDRREQRVARFIDWSWVYCWLSWCIAFREARTRAVIIHDLDALPLDPHLFERIYDNFVESRAQFCGIDYYTSSRNRIAPDLNVMRTFEMGFDVCHVRDHFRPIDLFNKLRWANGRVVDFDTMLYVQWKSPRRVVRPIDERALVHPSQLVCNYTDVLTGRTDLRGREHMLPILPYFMYLGDDSTPLSELALQINDDDARSVRLDDHEWWIDGISPGGWAWMEKQVRRVEQRLFQHTRPEVELYLSGFINRAGGSRTVGKESGPMSVAPR